MAPGQPAWSDGAGCKTCKAEEANNGKAGPQTPVIVTGGASGVGPGACQVLAEHGRPVAVCDIPEQLAHEVAAECRERYRVTTHV